MNVAEVAGQNRDQEKIVRVRQSLNQKNVAEVGQSFNFEQVARVRQGRQDYDKITSRVRQNESLDVTMRNEQSWRKF